MGGGCKVREHGPSTAFQELPIIDLSDMESPDLSKRETLASKVYDACMQVGFLASSMSRIMHSEGFGAEYGWRDWTFLQGAHFGAEDEPKSQQ